MFQDVTIPNFPQVSSPALVLIWYVFAFANYYSTIAPRHDIMTAYRLHFGTRQEAVTETRGPASAESQPWTFPN